jgi:hypothetical protein
LDDHEGDVAKLQVVSVGERGVTAAESVYIDRVISARAESKKWVRTRKRYVTWREICVCEPDLVPRCTPHPQPPPSDMDRDDLLTMLDQQIPTWHREMFKWVISHVADWD